jgi:hypothetical protein
MVEPGLCRVAEAEARRSTARRTGTAMTSNSQVRSRDDSKAHTMTSMDVDFSISYRFNLVTADPGPCATQLG